MGLRCRLRLERESGGPYRRGIGRGYGSARREDVGSRCIERALHALACQGGDLNALLVRMLEPFAVVLQGVQVCILLHEQQQQHDRRAQEAAESRVSTKVAWAGHERSLHQTFRAQITPNGLAPEAAD